MEIELLEREHTPENVIDHCKAVYEKAMKIMKTVPENTMFVGDQLFTDVWGAKKAGILTYLTKPIHPKEEIQIILKRLLEKIVLFFYHRSKR